MFGVWSTVARHHARRMRSADGVGEGGELSAGPHDGERADVRRGRMAAGLAVGLQPAVRVVVPQELRQDVEDLVIHRPNARSGRAARTHLREGAT